MTKRRLLLGGVIAAAGIVLLLFLLYLLPLDNLLPVQRKPNTPPQKAYDYYVVVDESTQDVLMYVPLVVSVNDELITEDNRLFRVVQVDGNTAYARFVRPVHLNQGPGP